MADFYKDDETGELIMLEAVNNERKRQKKFFNQVERIHKDVKEGYQRQVELAKADGYLDGEDVKNFLKSRLILSLGLAYVIKNDAENAKKMYEKYVEICVDLDEFGREHMKEGEYLEEAQSIKHDVELLSEKVDWLEMMSRNHMAFGNILLGRGDPTYTYIN
jgi:hypothetical protein